MTLKHTFTNTPVSEKTLVSMSKKELLAFFVQKLKHETEMIMELQQLDLDKMVALYYHKGITIKQFLGKFRDEILGLLDSKLEGENSRKVESGGVM